MAPLDPLEDLSDAEKDYHESSDEDFNPTTAPADDSVSSSDEEVATVRTTKTKKRRKAPADDALDSGDEVTIDALRKRKAKKQKGEKDGDDELLSVDEDGEGGLIKTRAQRRVERKERRPLARTEGATVDVDALWMQMSVVPLKPLYSAKAQTDDQSEGKDIAIDATTTDVLEEDEQVSVKKIYTFAGQRTTEEKQIPRSSLAKYLSDGWTAVDDAADVSNAEGAEPEAKDDQPKIRRPLRRPSRFDPNPTGFVRALPPEHQLTWPRKIRPISTTGQENAPAAEAAKARPEKAQKLNVVDKSRLDWTGFVDKEGIAEELDTHGKTKEAYLGRMDFLAGVEARREEERKRMKTAAAS